MTFIYQGTPYELPDGLQDITLQQIQAWSLQYGYDIGQGYMVTQNEKDADIMRMAMSKLWLDYVTAALSFFSGIPVDQVRQTIDISDIVQLISESGISLATQGPRVPNLPAPLVPPQQVTLSVNDAEGNPHPDVFEVYPANQDLDWNVVTRDTFVATITLSGYILELLNGDWSHFHLLCAGYVRRAGEVLSQELIDPAGSRGQEFQQQLLMSDGAPLAQFFLSQVAAVLQTTDYYTTKQLNPDGDTTDPGQVDPVTNFYADAVAQPDGTRIGTLYWDVRPEVTSYVINGSTEEDFSGSLSVAQGQISTYSVPLPAPPHTHYWRIKAQIDGMADSEWVYTSISYS